MFGRWRRERKAKTEADLLTLVAMLWARGDFEARWIAWTLFTNEVSKNLGSGPVGDISRFAEGATIANGLANLGYPESGKSLRACMITGDFSWEMNTDDEADPRSVRRLSLEEIMGVRAGPYRRAFYQFQQSLL